MRNTRKTLPARFDTLVRFINGPQLVAVVLQIMRPPPEPRARSPKSFPPADTRESAEKLCRPIARQSCPTVATIPRPPLSNRTSFVEWLGAESNRRHVDFQSTALPTELPSRDGADGVAPWDFHYATMLLQGKAV